MKSVPPYSVFSIYAILTEGGRAGYPLIEVVLQYYAGSLNMPTSCQ